MYKYQTWVFLGRSVANVVFTLKKHIFHVKTFPDHKSYEVYQKAFRKNFHFRMMPTWKVVKRFRDTESVLDRPSYKRPDLWHEIVDGI